MKEKSIGLPSRAGIRASKPRTGETIGSVTTQQNTSKGDSSSIKKPSSTLASKSQVIAERK